MLKNVSHLLSRLYKPGSLSLAATLLVASANHADAQAVTDYAGRWKFDDCRLSSPALANSSFNNTPATRGSSVGCTTDAEGRVDGAVNFTVAQPFDGVASTTVRVPGTTALRIGNTISVSARIRPGAAPGGVIFAKSFVDPTTGSSEKVFQLWLERGADGVNRLHWMVWFGVSPNSVGFSISSDVAIPASTWSQVGASYDPIEGFKVFLNGKLVGSNSTTVGDGPTPIAEAPVGTLAVLRLGGSAAGQTQGYLGAIDDVWISNGSCLDMSARLPDVDKELIIRHIPVVEDARTTGRGAWTFANLMEQMVPAVPGDVASEQRAASVMVEEMLNTWSTTQNMQGTTTPVPTRANMKTLILDKWPRIGTNLDLTRAPLRLLAIVNRIDIRNLDKGHAGEGRFVFGVVNPDNNLPRSFTIILEYRLPARTPADVRQWARLFHDLGAITDPAAYNTALQAITDRFTKRGADPVLLTGTPNPLATGNALNQLRTNELSLSFPWELRQFALVKNATNTVSLKPVPVTQEPQQSFNNTATLANYITANSAKVLKGTHEVGTSFVNNGVTVSPFQAGSALNNPTTWNAPGIANNLRFAFAVNTCSGCHSPETETSFTHIKIRSAGEPSELSTFIKGGGTKINPLTGQTFNDLARRRDDLKDVLSCRAGAITPPTARTAAVSTSTTTSTSSTSSTTSLSKGIDRVH